MIFTLGLEMAISKLEYEYVIDPASGCCVYFVQQGANGPIKIGRSNFCDLDTRITTLQTGNPQKLNLLARFAATPAYEIVLHRMFEDSNIRGEWYTPTQDLLDIIDMIRNKDVMPLLGMLVRLQKIYGIRQNVIHQHRRSPLAHKRAATRREKRAIDRYIDSVLDG